MDTLTPKGWTDATLARLSITRDGSRWRIPVYGDDGELRAELRYSDTGAKPKMLAGAGDVRDLFPAPETLPDGGELYVVEGEPDAVTMTELGFAAVAYPGTGKDDPGWPWRLARSRDRVVLIPDCDTGGRARAAELAVGIAVYAPCAVADLDPSRHDGFDVGDLYADALHRVPERAREASRAYITRVSRMAPPVTLAPAPTAVLSEPKTSVEIVNLADVTPQNMRFLWYPYLPLGRVVIVAGAPGHGKSQFSALIASDASRGKLKGDYEGEPARVLMMCAEDDLAMTTVPRLIAVGADMRQIDTVNVVTEYPNGLTSNGLIKLPTDVEIIHSWAKQHPTARLIMLDPVASFFDRSHNTLYNQDVRDALGPLVAVAERYGVTVVIVLHLNKSESREVANRIAESHGFQALARSVMALGPDPADPEGDRGSLKVVAISKANLVKPGSHSMRFAMRSVTLNEYTPPIETSRLEYLDDCEITADDLLMSVSERTVRIEADEFLSEYLDEHGGWAKTGDVRSAAMKEGHSWRTVERVRHNKGYQRMKQPGVKHGPWWIGAPHAHARDMPSASGSVGGVDDNGVGDVGGLGGIDEQVFGQHRQDHPRQVEYRAPARANGVSNLDDYREWEARRLGERDDEDDER